MGYSLPEYYRFTIVSGKVVEDELDPSEVKELIKDMPLIYELDRNNKIWGDSDFKDRCPQKFKEKYEQED